MSEKRVEAAGGVVRDEDGRVLLVHRPRYDDWTLPKGKLDPDETFEQAALREVQEETGLRCTLGRELATTTYRDNKDRPKVVRYWLMEVEKGQGGAPPTFATPQSGQRGAPPPFATPQSGQRGASPTFATPQGGEFEPNDEVDEVCWLPLAEAVEALTYDRDREVLARLTP